MSATRYDESGGVGAKVTRRPPRPSLSSRVATPFESATASVGTPETATRQIALKPGSSKQGKSAARVGGLELRDGQRPGAIEARAARG